MLSRGEFLASFGAFALRPSELRVNAARLRASIEELSIHGCPPGGNFADGVTRVGFSDADVSGRAFAMRLMKDAGLDARVDPAGNIVARRTGSSPSLPPVVFGSHIDSVPAGGNFDGDLGSLAAIEVIRVLNEHRIHTRRTLEIVIWTAEEAVAYGRSLFGSRAAAGRLAPGEMDEVWQGHRKTEAVRKIGGDPDRIDHARREAGSFHCYLELHIEQGPVLERAATPIGVVDGIVSIDRYEASIHGFANHAGTTAMADRQDALVAAARLILAVREAVVAVQGRQVGTVGRLEVHPNSANVIPGLVTHSIELRDLSAEKLRGLAATIEDRARRIALETGTRIELTHRAHNPGAAAAPQVQAAIEEAARAIGLAFRHLPSGAGHDAQSMALLGPMGMIFVPSRGGISHSPKEWTSWEDCARGADVLLQAVVAMAA